DLELGKMPKPADERQNDGRSDGLQVGDADEQIEKREGGVRSPPPDPQLIKDGAAEKEGDDQDAEEQEPAELPPVRLNPGVGCSQTLPHPPTVPASLKIGRYMAMTRPPTVVPRKSMRSGSIMAV